MLRLALKRKWLCEALWTSDGSRLQASIPFWGEVEKDALSDESNKGHIGRGGPHVKKATTGVGKEGRIDWDEEAGKETLKGVGKRRGRQSGRP